MDRGAWQATVHRVAKSRTQLRDLAFMHTSFICIPLTVTFSFSSLCVQGRSYPRDYGLIGLSPLPCV